MNKPKYTQLHILLFYALAFCLFLLCACGDFALPKRTVKATSAQTSPTTGAYACILYEDTFFYATPDESKGLFLLPVTYYVKLIAYGNEYSQVEYLYDDTQTQKLVGYVKTSQLTFVEYIPNRPYFYHVFELRYRIDEALLETSDFLNEITLTCAYYGDYKVGSKTYCYVLRGETFGYVPKPNTLLVERNNEYAEYLALQTSTTEPTTPAEESNTSPLQIAILVALCLLVPVLAALILKPPRRPPYELDND